MNLIRWRDRGPLTNWENAFENVFDNMLSRFQPGEITPRLPEAFRRGVFPVLNMAESEKEVTVSVELPGLNEEDIHVDVMGNTLTVSGERKWEQEKKKKDFHRVESQYGSFQRSITLPEGLRTDPEAITATYKKGMLEIVLPKVEPTPTTAIKVKKG